MVCKYNLSELVFINGGLKMDDKERIEYVKKELEAIYEDLDANINEQVLLQKFLKSALDVAKGAEPTYKLSEIKKSIL